MRNFTIVLLALAATTLLSGCSGGNSTAPVSGEVTYKGQPLEQGTITLYPEKGRPVSGRIEKGKIVDVTTITPNDGAAPGNYDVAIESREKTSDMYAKPKSFIPARYGVAKQSGLKAEIKSGRNDLKFELKD